MLPRKWFEPKVLLPFYTMPKVKLMKRKWNEILEVMVSIYTMPSIFPFSYFHLRKAPPSHHSQQHISTSDRLGVTMHPAQPDWTFDEIVKV